MRLKSVALMATIACGVYVGNVYGDQTDTLSNNHILPTSYCEQGGCATEEASCGCSSSACSDGCSSSACGSGCSSGFGWKLPKLDCSSLFDNCCLGKPYRLCDEYCGYSAGGWLQMGYHNKNLPATQFNNHRSNFNLHQGWLYAEKAIDARCGFDIGGRVDYLYGVDAQNTQAFGTDPNGWDNSWDHGSYGSALPQAYVEMGYGDWSVKVGHFFTILGNEVVAAPDNFFYSHSYTMTSSEPFTHSGFLTSYNPTNDLTIYNGYVMGWDSGLDNNGDAYLGGFRACLDDCTSVTFATTIGRFNEGVGGQNERGFASSLVVNTWLSSRLNYIFQTDFLDTENAAGGTVREAYGINQYLLYNVNDCWAFGGRFEWYSSDGVFAAAGQEDDIYAVTLGANYRPHANLIIRPELRYDWDGAQVAGLEDGDEQATFGFDTILTF